jgi:hypothetical protein
MTIDRFIYLLLPAFLFGCTVSIDPVGYHPHNDFPVYRATFKHPPSKTPSNKVPDAPIAGNGDIGVVYGGTSDSLRFYISKNDFWRAKPGYPDGGTFLPGGVDINIPDLNGATYHAEQIIADGVVIATFNKEDLLVTMTSWVASEENLIVFELETNKSCVWDYTLWTPQHDEVRTEKGEVDGTSWVSRHFDAPDLEWPTHITLALDGPGLDKKLIPGKKTVFGIAATTNHDQKGYQRDAITRAQQISTQKLDQLSQTHTAWWKQFWSQSKIAIGDTLLEKFYYGSQYLLACASRNKQFPPGLWGNTLTMDATFEAWAGDYHTNYNYQAPWWAAYASNHIELTDPYDTPILEYMENAKKHAQKQLNVRGVYFPVGIGPKGFCTSRFPLTVDRMEALYQTNETDIEGGYMFLGQKSNAVFTTANMLIRFYYTYDVEYARKIYPFLKEVAVFWEDYLTYENGRYVSYNDNFWEVGPWMGKDWKKDYGDYNPTTTLGLLRMFFRGIIDVSEYLETDLDQHKTWTHILEHLSAIPLVDIDGKIRVKACEGGDGSGSRTKPGFGRVMMHGLVYPSFAFGPENDPEFIQLLKAEVERWETDPGGDATWDNMSNGFAVYFAGAARIGISPQVILSKLKERISKTALTNLWITQIGGGVETLSAVPGTINEMLMQSYEGIIRLFPSWPEGQDAAFENHRARGAFLVTSALKSGEVQYVNIYSEKGRLLSLRNPWKNKEIEVRKQNGNISVYRGERLEIFTKPGDWLYITLNK